MQGKCITKTQVLEDTRSSGKPRPWSEKKSRSIKAAESFKRREEPSKAYRVRHCGEDLSFIRDESGLHLHEAAFCRERMCPMCQWRRSLKVFTQVSQVMDRVLLDAPNLTPIFLSLTQRNVPAESLQNEIQRIMIGWRLFTNHWTVKKRVQGFFRALELTRKSAARGFHPHIHAILMVDEQTYFKGADYLKTRDFGRLWRTCCKLDYDPIVDIRSVKTATRAGAMPMHKAAAEVAKYSVKDADIITDNERETDEALDAIGRALKGRRLYAFGGIMKRIAKQLEVDNAGEGDLVHVEGEAQIRSDLAQMIETYGWDMGISNYVRTA